MAPRKNIWFALILAVIMVNQGAFAQTEKLTAAVNQAERLKNSIDANFPQFVEAQILNAIQNHFIHLVWDHKSVKSILEWRALTGLKQIAEIDEELRLLSDSLSVTTEASQGMTWDDAAVRVFYLATVAARHQSDAMSIAEDSAALTESWLNQCRASLRSRLEAYVNPLAYVQLLDYQNAGQIDPHFEFTVEINLGSDGQIKSTRPSLALNNNVENAIGVTGMAMVANGDPYVSAIGSMVVLGLIVFKLTRFGIENSRLVKSERRFIELNEQIRTTQLQLLREAANKIPAWIEQKCEQSFPLQYAKFLNSKEVESYRDKATRSAHSALTTIGNLQHYFQERLKHLKQVYYPGVANRFASLVTDRFNQINAIETETANTLKNLILPLGIQVERRRTAGDNGPRLWRAKQELWSALILADGNLRHAPGFSFLPGKSKEPVEINRSWHQLGPKISEMLK